MNLKNINKKILYLALALLIIAGMLTVALKGFKVDLMLERHESINFLINKDFNVKEVKDICKEIFGNKQVVVRKVEVFSDAVNINISSITDEEKEQLVNKMNEKYGTTVDVASIQVKSIPNVRIRDMVKPYLVPVAISVLIIAAYIIIRFKKMNSLKLMIKLLVLILVTEGAIASVIAIARIPFSGILVNLMAIIALLLVIAYINKTEKEYIKMTLEKSKKGKK